jgi:hypothetical protein
MPLVTAANVRFGSQADMTAAICDVCFTPESGHPQRQVDVRFGPKADIAMLVDHLVGASK